MTLNPWTAADRLFAPAPIVGELITDYRARIAHERLQSIERRQLELAEQVSEAHAPGVRIRIWERLHGVVLPRDPAHQLLKVVASGTDLTLEQVLEEQRLRAAPVVVVKAPSAPALTAASAEASPSAP